MVPQQAHYQFRWLKSVRAHLSLSICYLLSAICYSVAINGRDELLLVRVGSLPMRRALNLGRAGARPCRLLFRTVLPFAAFSALTAFRAFTYE
jgi:hypothetical protein